MIVSDGTKIRIAVIAGSRRPNRRALTVAEWVCADAKASADLGIELTPVDLDDIALPPLAEPTPAAFGSYTLEHTRRWSELIASYDAYVLVTPEYNHSTSAVLKDALDHLYLEWQDKPVAFVGYGIDGGVRAVEHLRGITAELGLAGVGPTVTLSIADDFEDTGVLAARARPEQQRTRMLVGLARWARALRPLRATEPADSTETARPVLGDPAQAPEAQEAVATLVSRLQAGLDGGNADLYDSMFAEDVLWGSPYGQVLRGFGPLNTIHRAQMDAPKPGHSRYEVVQTSTPAPGIVTTHVRRLTLDATAGDGPEFSEMALYVLVRHRGEWWLAAGQNTPLRGKPTQAS